VSFLTEELCSGLHFAYCSSISSFININSSTSLINFVLLYNCYLCSINHQVCYPSIIDIIIVLYSFAGNKCLNLGNNTPPYMQPVKPGSLFSVISKPLLPPAMAPLPPLTKDEVVEPPLPPVAEIAPAASPAAGTKSPPGNAQPKVSACFFLSSLAVFVASIFLL
jgi:hypothetical protein